MDTDKFITLNNLKKFKDISDSEKSSILVFDGTDTAESKELLTEAAHMYKEDKNCMLLCEDMPCVKADITLDDTYLNATFIFASFTGQAISKWGIEGSGVVSKKVTFSERDKSIEIEKDKEYVIAENKTGNGALGVSNTITYTPTDNYHPATKKYVDDSIALANQYVYVFNGEINDNNKELFKKACYALGYDKPCVLTYHNNPAFHIELGLIDNLVEGSFYFLEPDEYYVETEGGSDIQANTFDKYGISGRSFEVTRIDYKEADNSLVINEHHETLKLIDKGTPLSTDNIEEYTPTDDYNPATKKYVDDKIKDAIKAALEGEY